MGKQIKVWRLEDRPPRRNRNPPFSSISQSDFQPQMILFSVGRCLDLLSGLLKLVADCWTQLSSKLASLFKSRRRRKRRGQRRIDRRRRPREWRHPPPSHIPQVGLALSSRLGPALSEDLDEDDGNKAWRRRAEADSELRLLNMKIVRNLGNLSSSLARENLLSHEKKKSFEKLNLTSSHEREKILTWQNEWTRRR